jgi:hypothetical protein
MNLKLTKPALWAGAGVGLLGYLTLWPKDLRVPCAINHVTGLQCPGCGTTRALTALVEGDIATAFNFNQLIFFIPLFLIALQLTKHSQNKKIYEVSIVTIALIATLGFFLVRNNFI